MTLRPRLALTLFLVALPLVALLFWLRSRAQEWELDDSLVEFALAHMQGGGRQRCESDPRHFLVRLGNPPPPAQLPPSRRDPPPPRRDGSAGDPPPPPPPPPPRTPPPHPRPPPGVSMPPTELWAYDPTFASANPEAPALPAELVAALEGGAERAGAAWRADGTEGRQVAVRMPWMEGPCAVVLARRPFGPLPASTRLLLYGAVAVAVGLLLALVLAAGPLVRRIRRLTRDVRAAAAARYAHDVAVKGDDELAGLAAAFNEAGAAVRTHVQDLERRETTLRDFVSNTTHDVMIPLTVLQGHLDALRRQVRAGDGADPERVRAGMEEAHYVACLVQNLAAAAKLEAGDVHLELRPVDLAGLVERVAARHRPVAAEREIAVEVSMPPVPVVVKGDETLLEQALGNVVHNAIRYGRRGGHVGVLLETSRGDPPHFSVRIVDDGPGVPDEELPRLTERAWRGRRARTRAPAGAGLGLAIAGDVARRHGITLTVSRSSFGGLEVAFEGERLPESDTPDA